MKRETVRFSETSVTFYQDSVRNRFLKQLSVLSIYFCACIRVSQIETSSKKLYFRKGRAGTIQAITPDIPAKKKNLYE
jgi:hypothetical protein